MRRFGVGRSGLRVLPGGVTMFIDAFTLETGRRTHFFFQGVAAG